MSRIAPLASQCTAIFVLLAGGIFYLKYYWPPLAMAPKISKRIYGLAFFFGTFARLLLSWQMPGNFDRQSWEIAVEVFSRGGNIYAESFRYNTSPVWFWILGMLGVIQKFSFPGSFHFIVGFFLSAVDFFTAMLLATWPGKHSSERKLLAAAFYLNPVSILLTGVHGQFDSVAILCLLLGLWGMNRYGKTWAWAWTTMGFVTKHILFYEVPIVLCHLFSSWKARIGWMLLSAGLFLGSFMPYWVGAKKEILQNVFFYQSYAMPYGLSALPSRSFVTPCFVGALVVYSFWLDREKQLEKKMLLGVLFFLTFTTGLGVQYFILPIALGVLRPSRGFLAFTLVTTLYLLGSYFNMDMRIFSWMPLWAVWCTAAAWWASTHFLRSG